MDNHTGIEDGFNCFVGGPNYEEQKRKRVQLKTKGNLARLLKPVFPEVPKQANPFVSGLKPTDEQRLEQLKLEKSYSVDDTTLMVEEFHRKFYLTEVLDNRPQIPSPKLCLLRIQCLTEEIAELAHAFGKGDLVEVLDALTDIQYFLDGTYLLCGLEGVKLRGMLEVHKSNLTKLDGNGEPVKDASGRVIKSKNYERPDLGEILEEYGHWQELSRTLSCETPREYKRRKNDSPKE